MPCRVTYHRKKRVERKIRLTRFQLHRGKISNITSARSPCQHADTHYSSGDQTDFCTAANERVCFGNTSGQTRWNDFHTQLITQKMPNPSLNTRWVSPSNSSTDPISGSWWLSAPCFGTYEKPLPFREHPR